MRPPLISMFIRNVHDDAKYKGKPGVHHVLNSPAGGAFGKVRDEGRTPHQGWDLYASVGTPAFAIADGEIVTATRGQKLGRYVVLQFQNTGRPDLPRKLFAVYAHLCLIRVAPGSRVHEGDVIGLTGTDGNAHGQPPHLHFEIRTTPDFQKGLADRVSPGEILGHHYGSGHQ